MKKIIIVGIAIFAFMGLTFGVNSYLTVQKANNQCIAGRGCCSGHGGVCGCSDGRSKCCDDTLSPSCHCFKDDVKGLGI